MVIKDRKIGLEVERWVYGNAGNLINPLPQRLWTYKKQLPEGLFHVDYNAAEIAYNPSELSNLADQLSNAPEIINREVRDLGYSGTTSKHIHLNIDVLPSEESRLLKGQKPISIGESCSPDDAKIKEIFGDFSQRMGNPSYMSGGRLIRRQSGLLVLHTQFDKFDLNNLVDFYKAVDSYLRQ